MANDKTYDRHVNIWINGKQVSNDLSSIEKELIKLRNEWKRTTIGTQEWIDKGKEYKKFKQTVDEHNASLRKTPGILDNIKSNFGFVAVAIGVAYGVFQSFKGVIESTDESSDRFARTMGGIKEAIGEVSRAMADGNFKDFFKNIKGAVEEGQRYVDMQDAIGDSARALSLEEEKVADEILALRIIQADATKDRDKQIRAGEEIERKMAGLADKRAKQAQKTLDNEMESARFKSKLDDEIILSFLRQDEAMTKNMEVGKKYYDLVQQYNGLTTTQLVFQGGKIMEQLEALGSEAPKFAAIYAGMSKVTEDHRDRIVAAEKGVSEAKRSATEDILRQINKLNSARAAEADEAEKATEKIIKTEKDRSDAHKKQEIIAERENQKFIDDEIKRMDDEAKKKKEIEHKSADDHRAQSAKTERENQKFIDDEIKRMDDEAKKKKEIKEESNIELLALTQDFVTGIIGLEETLFDRQLSKLDAKYKADIAAAGENAAAKKKIDEDYDRNKIKILRKAAIAEKVAAIFSIGVNTVVGVSKATSEGILGWWQIPLIIAAGALQAVMVAAKPLPQFYFGGYSGPGGKYTPKGIVHADEWIAPSEMVMSPQYGPIIQALEQDRLNGLPGFVNGGMATGDRQQAIGGNSAAALIGTNPKLERTMDEILSFLAYLKEYGVKNMWPWQEIDNMRKGMNKLEDIEGDVTL